MIHFPQGLAVEEIRGKVQACCIDGKEGAIKDGGNYYTLESHDIAALLTDRKASGSGWEVFLSGASEYPTLAVCKDRRISIRSLHRLSGWERAGMPRDVVARSTSAAAQAERLCAAQEQIGVRPGSGLTGAVKQLAPAMQTFRRHKGRDIWAREHLVRGGRCEVLRTETTEAVRVWDIKSAYAGVYMHGFPGELVSRQARFPRGTDLFAARVTVSIPEDERVPMAPHKRKSGKLVFPVGTWETWLMGPEVLALAESGHIAKVHECEVYSSANPLTEFAEKVYGLRLSATCDIMRDYCKLLLVSGYGVMASHGSYPKWVIPHDSLDEQMIMPGVYRVWDAPRNTMAHTIGAAYILSAMRARVGRALQAEPMACYCAIDAVTLPADSHLDMGDRPGDWSPGQAQQGGKWFAQNTYTLGGGTIKRAGGIERDLAEEYLCGGTVVAERRAAPLTAMKEGSLSRKLVTMAMRTDGEKGREIIPGDPYHRTRPLNYGSA